MMIYKEPGNVKIHRLRVIHLYEADQSTLWGKKWGKRLRKAVNDKTLNSGEFGGLPGRDCTVITFLEEVRLGDSNFTRYPFANFDNDFTSCYDRILCAISSLCGKKFGIYRDIVFVHAKTLEAAEFKLKTSIGISSSSYVRCAKFPILGTCQGSTNSPMIWTFVSSVLFDTHAKTCNGMIFSSPDGDYFVQYTMVGFVNDSTCITGGSKDDSYDDLKSKMTHDAQL